MQGMRDLLRGSLGRGLRSLSPLDRLAAAWPVVCGPALASHGELTVVEAGRLTIRVPDPVWRRQLHSSRERLRSELSRVASVPLREIHFEGAAPPAQAKARTPTRPRRESPIPTLSQLRLQQQSATARDNLCSSRAENPLDRDAGPKPL